MSERVDLRVHVANVMAREKDPGTTWGQLTDVVLDALVAYLGITPEMVDAISYESRRYWGDTSHRQHLADAADILQSLLDAGGDDE